MDIFIKSFNRPYFLDRCIESVYQNISGFSRIIVLDDGTPQKYLDHLSHKFDEIIIKKSEFYDHKSTMIISGCIQKEHLKFPGDFWYRECSKSKGSFLLLEDDMFVVAKIDLESIRTFMDFNKLQIFKMLWLGSPLMNQGDIVDKGKYELLFPLKHLSISHFERTISNKLRKISILIRLGLYSMYFKKNILPYYSLYIVAGAVYNIEYFEYMWKGIHTLDENTQILRSLKYYDRSNIELKVGKSKEEIIKTSFKTSATNDFPKIDFSIFEFNSILNEAWINNSLNRTDLNSFDISTEQIKLLLSRDQYANWVEWFKEFTKAYKDLECIIE